MICVCAATAQKQSFASFSGSEKCSSIPPATAAGSSAPLNFAIDYSCDSLAVPSAWQKGYDNNATEQYDLAIVGAGIGGAYLVNRIHEEFSKQGRPLPKITLVERTAWTGGRLMSAFGAGALNLAVAPGAVGAVDATLAYPMPEYGGMRIDPQRYPLIFNKVVQYSDALFGPGSCFGGDACNAEKNCCPSVLSTMDVGSIRYRTLDPGVGPWLASSNVSTPSRLYSVDKIDANTLRRNVDYHLTNIASQAGSPFDTCVQLGVAAADYFGPGGLGGGVEAPVLWNDAISVVCSPAGCAKVPGLCRLCGLFPDPGAAVMSCSGYDLTLATLSYGAAVGLLDEVVNAHDKTRLYLFKQGFQRFAEGLLFVNSTIPIAPVYEKQLNGVRTACGNATALALAQVNTIAENATALSGRCKAAEGTAPVTLDFADGSSITAKAAYLTMLPFDMSNLDGLTPWREPLELATSPASAVKVVLSWSDASAGLSSALGLTPCVPGPCQRLILDGPAPDWILRQVWLWDPQTIMVYDTAPGEPGSPNPQYPANRLALIAREQGMDALVSTIMRQLRLAADLPGLPDPDWARLKTWPAGSILPGWTLDPGLNTTAEGFSAAVSRPLGAAVPVYYGNSEAAANGGNHGWAEGALEMVEAALPALMAHLGAPPPQQVPTAAASPGPGAVDATSSGRRALGSSAWAAVAGVGLALLALH